jgi:putative hydrolase of the HAD superfamily
VVKGVLFALGHTLVVPDEDLGETAVGSTTHALLESLRRRGLRLGVVTNGSGEEVESLALAPLLDAAVTAADVGAAKPDARIFVRALDALGVEGYQAVFVGDRLREDVAGAEEIGMITVQALWFRADEPADGVEPDFMAFTQMDVLNIVDRLNRE